MFNADVDRTYNPKKGRVATKTVTTSLIRAIVGNAVMPTHIPPKKSSSSRDRQDAMTYLKSSKKCDEILVIALDEAMNVISVGIVKDSSRRLGFLVKNLLNSDDKASVDPLDISIIRAIVISRRTTPKKPWVVAK